MRAHGRTSTLPPHCHTWFWAKYKYTGRIACHQMQYKDTGSVTERQSCCHYIDRPPFSDYIEMKREKKILERPSAMRRSQATLLQLWRFIIAKKRLFCRRRSGNLIHYPPICWCFASSAWEQLRSFFTVSAERHWSRAIFFLSPLSPSAASTVRPPWCQMFKTGRPKSIWIKIQYWTLTYM